MTFSEGFCAKFNVSPEAYEAEVMKRALYPLARVIRWAMVRSGTRNAAATSGTVRPPSSRRVRATCASGPRAGWQQVNSSRSRSSVTEVTGAPGTSGAVTSGPWAPAPPDAEESVAPPPAPATAPAPAPARPQAPVEAKKGPPIALIGGGVAGVATALELAERLIRELEVLDIGDLWPLSAGSGGATGAEEAQGVLVAIAEVVVHGWSQRKTGRALEGGRRRSVATIIGVGAVHAP